MELEKAAETLPSWRFMLGKWHCFMFPKYSKDNIRWQNWEQMPLRWEAYKVVWQHWYFADRMSISSGAAKAPGLFCERTESSEEMHHRGMCREWLEMFLVF